MYISDIFCIILIMIVMFTQVIGKLHSFYFLILFDFIKKSLVIVI